MAVTALQALAKRGNCRLKAFPMALGDYLYQGALGAILPTGLAGNLTAARILSGINMVGFVADGSENGNTTTTTAAGSISGDNEEASGLSNGEKTVRKFWIEGEFKITGASGLAQTSVGKILYVTDNGTATLSPVDAHPIGLIVEYISATACWIDLNVYSKNGSSGFRYITRSLVAATVSTAGAVCAIANPAGKTIIVHDIWIDVTTAPTDTAGGIDAGIAANGTTSSDTLIDGAVLASAKIFSPDVNKGTNGGMNRKMTSSQYVTITSVVETHYDLTALVGTVTLVYREVQ